MASLLIEELRPKLPYPPEQAVIRHMVATALHGDGAARQEVIAVCALRARLEAAKRVPEAAK